MDCVRVITGRNSASFQGCGKPRRIASPNAGQHVAAARGGSSAETFAALPCSWYWNEDGEFRMSARFIHMSFSGLARRPMLAALIVYWIAIGAAALILAFAVRHDAACERGVQLPYLARLAPRESSTMTTARPDHSREISTCASCSSQL